MGINIIRRIRDTSLELAIVCVAFTVLLGTFYPKGTMLLTDVLVWTSGAITLCVIVFPLLFSGSKNQSSEALGGKG